MNYFEKTGYFHDAYDIVMKHEGGYVNDPADRGGETYKGISRVHHPQWEGWFTIDALRTTKGFPQNLGSNQVLDNSVRRFYKLHYFTPFHGEKMPETIAVEMFDIAVNMGVKRAVLFLQIALNCLNRNEKSYRDIRVDGSYGGKTETALALYRACEKFAPDGLLVKVLNILQGAHYLNIMKDDSTQERFARGWLKRVRILK